jgi:hypothetical protein
MAPSSAPRKIAELAAERAPQLRQQQQQAR